MNNKVIAGVSTLALLVTMSAALAGSGSAPFKIEIVVDTTIVIPTIDDSCGGGTNDNILEFQPGITGLDDASYAVAIDSCATNASGDWSVQMSGNVPLNLSFKLDSAAPQGVTIAISNENNSPDTFTQGNELALSNVDSTPSWALGLADAYELELWQRVAADTTALGDTSYDRSIIVTSSYTTG